MDDLSKPFIQGALSGQEFQLNKFLIQEAPIKLEKEKLALKIATSDFSRRQQMADLLAGKMSQIPPGQNPLTEASNTLMEIGEAAAKAGLPEEAIEAISKGSAIATQQLNAATKRAQLVEQQTKYADQLLGTIPDDVSPEEGQRLWDQMNSHVEMMTGTPSAMKNQKYSPQLVRELRDASVKKRSQAQEDLDKAKAEWERAHTKSEKALEAQRYSAASLNKVKEEGVARKYGSAGLIPKGTNVSAVTDAIVKDSADTMSTADARDIAKRGGVALDAETFINRDGLDQAAAVAKAVQNAKRDGRIPSDAKQYVRKGTSPKNAFIIPADPDEQSKFKFEDGKWYDTPDGPMHFNATPTKQYPKGGLYPLGEGPEDDDEPETEN